MSTGNEPKQLGVGARLREPPSERLVEAFAQELRYAERLYEGLSFADLAHVVMLVECGLVPRPEGQALLNALVDLHDAGFQALPLEAKWGDLYNNRDAELQRRLGKTAGWLHLARARREALTLGWLISLRQLADELFGAIHELLQTLVALARAHQRTIMPDFTYLQHAQPTTLGHYLLGFAFPVCRDASRLSRELSFLNSSPGGAASTNGSRLPLDRDRVRELLGFERLVTHARDAMWQSDLPIQWMSVLVSLATTADRLVEELQIWATAEFAFVELADRHCRTSVIMPHKRNPYALAVIRGKARELVGNLVSVITTNQTPSGQIDNRNTAYELVPKATTDVTEMLALLSEVLGEATFHTGRLREQAGASLTVATELVDILVQEEKLDPRSAHEVVGMFSSRVGQVGDLAEKAAPLAQELERAFEEVAGRKMTVSGAALLASVTPESTVETRTGVGAVRPSRWKKMCEEIEAWDRWIVQESELRRQAGNFPERLRQAVAELCGRKW